MLSIGSIVWGVIDVQRAKKFWCEALDYKEKYPCEEDWCILIPKQGEGTQLSLMKTSSPAAKRHHIDLFTTNQEEELQRLFALGARVKKWNYEKGADYKVLEDTEGNPFCVVQI